MLRHGSLFSGIGGFDLAAELAGYENVFHCEWNPFAQRVLQHYWPNAESFYDITKSDFSKYEYSIDIISGGFPCQPFSSAGQRRGTEDSRHLWPAMLDVIRSIKPRYVVGENVYGLLNWNDGMVFNEVCADLEAEGYEVQSFLLPAAAVNAIHRRYRVWIVAHRHGATRQDKFYDQRTVCQQFSQMDKCEPINTERFESALCGENDGLPRELDGITFHKWREESIKGYGNAIVPQVALQIFKAINQYEQYKP